MKLLYEVSVPSKANGTIVLPVGVSQVKMGAISSYGLNQCVSIRFPIINGKSPNTFTAYNSSDAVVVFYVFVEELGGIPDPDYFTGGVASE